ncbi:MAG TPA: hypothetical protein VHE81_13760, partial [Lacipirellulaceae bacterium]|nr:hypothetical protein [Lacipirellulaceae bacterium]
MSRLLAAMTLVAVTLGIAARFPDVAFYSLCLAFPLSATAAYARKRDTVSARFVLMIIGTLFLITGTGCWMDIVQNHGAGDVASVMLMSGFGLFLMFIAWSIGP